MATFAKQVLSGSTDGKGILVTANASAGTTIHTGSTTTTHFDEVWLYAQNTDTTARKLTIEWGGTTSPNDLIEITIPAESGLTLVVKAFAATASVVTIHGFVNRIS